MLEKEKITTEEAIRFLDTLEFESEEELSGIIQEIQDIEQKLREVDYALSEYEQKPDSNMNFFSPVGVYEEGEEKKQLLQTAEELRNRLPVLNTKLEQYKRRKEQIHFIREMLSEKQNEKNESLPTEYPVLDKEQGIQLLESQERDRNRIARDLHDSSVQSLTGLMHKAELCMRLMDIDGIRVKLELQTMIETIRTVINGMREIIYNLRPMSLDNLGLTVAIESYCMQMKKNYNLDVEFLNLAEEPGIPSIYKVTMYRILQEACYNVVKHAKASKITIRLSYDKNRLRLDVMDNGIGFDTELRREPSGETPYGFGLSMMKERVTLLGGIIRIESVANEGTTVSVEIPWEKKEELNGDD